MFALARNLQPTQMRASRVVELGYVVRYKRIANRSAFSKRAAQGNLSQSNGLDLAMPWFGTRRSMVQIHSPRPSLQLRSLDCARDSRPSYYSASSFYFILGASETGFRTSLSRTSDSTSFIQRFYSSMCGRNLESWNNFGAFEGEDWLC